MSIEQLISFTGWCLVLNIGILTLSTVLILLLKGIVRSLHGKLFGVSAETINAVVYGYLGAYKLLILVFNLVPYLALKLMVS